MTVRLWDLTVVVEDIGCQHVANSFCGMGVLSLVERKAIAEMFSILLVCVDSNFSARLQHFRFRFTLFLSEGLVECKFGV